MLITSDSNQFLTPLQDTDSRIKSIRVWKTVNEVTYVAIGQALGGITGKAVQKLLEGERIPTERFNEFVAFGIPENLLPPAIDVPRGRPKRVPDTPVDCSVE